MKVGTHSAIAPWINQLTNGIVMPGACALECDGRRVDFTLVLYIAHGDDLDLS